MTRLTGPRQVRAVAESSGLVQRGDILALCDRFLATAADGKVLVLEAPRGGGKTAALEAACRLADLHRLRVLRARGSEPERGFAFGVVRQLLERPLLAAKRREREALLAGPALPAAVALGLEGGDPPSGCAANHALYRLLASLAEARPLVLAVDDLQVADAESLDFLRYLARRQAEQPVVTIGTLTPARSGAPIELLEIEQAGTVAPLAPLDETGVAQLLERAGAPDSRDAAAELTRFTSGNPFLVASVLAHPQDDVPAAVVREVALRLARVPADAALLARAAAVLGDGATVAAAARVMDAQPGAALNAMDALADAHVLELTRTIRFTAPLLEAACRRLLSPGERSRLNRLAAEAVLATGGSPTAAAAHLMRSEGSGEEWAVDVLAQAAEQADDPRRAAAYLRHALTEQPPAAERGRLLRDLAAAELASGGSGVDPLAEAVGLLARGSERAETCHRLATVLWGVGRYGEAGQAFARGLAELGAERGTLRARLQAGHLAAARIEGGARRSVRSVRDAELREPAMAAQLALELLLAGGSRKRVVEIARSALDDGRLLDRPDAGPSAEAAVCSLVWCDDLEAAERFATVALEGDRPPAFTAAGGVMLLLRACAMLRGGRLSEARRDAEAALTAAPVVAPVPVPPADALLAHVELETGHAADARAHAQRALQAARSVDMEATAAGAIQQAFALAARGCVALAERDDEAALTDLLACGRCLSGAEVRTPALDAWRSRAAIAARRLGDVGRASALAGEERELARAFGGPRTLGLAIWAGAAGQRRAARLRAAADALGDAPAPLDRARVLVELGAELRRTGHRRAARDALRVALDVAVRCGAIRLAERAREQLVATGGRPRRARVSGVASLTPRELQVAELAARGASNRAIADRLIVSQKTIEWHLANAYRKLELRGRGGLSRLLAE
jgi:DNA-binding CsgD family transcriptional regulator